jgi:hypothetical protein
MIRRLLGTTLWLVVGHALLGSLYWTLLNVPESNTLALSASALLALLLAIGAGLVETTALIALKPEEPIAPGRWRRALARSVRLLPVFVLALLVWLVVSWIAGWIEAWHWAHASEMDAWMIAKFNWTNITGLHRTINYVVVLLRYVVGISLAVSLVAVAAFDGGAAVLRLRWIARALSPLQLATIGVALFGLIWLPWQAAYWRPRNLPATSVEIAFAGFKLLVLALLAHLGWAVVLWSGHRHGARKTEG